MRRSFPTVRGQQAGAVLIVSLLLLLVMTLLALGASHSTNIQERMAGNQRDQELALQSAEASLRAAEDLLSPTRTIVTCIDAAATCEAYESLPANLRDRNNAWWDTWGRDYADYTDHPGQIAKTPEFVIDHVAESRDSLSTGGSYLNVVRDFHRSTARSAGMTETAQVVVQSTYSRVSFE